MESCSTSTLRIVKGKKSPFIVKLPFSPPLYRMGFCSRRYDLLSKRHGNVINWGGGVVFPPLSQVNTDLKIQILSVFSVYIGIAFFKIHSFLLFESPT